jgi:CRISPR-associated protein (TIGR03986 family)
MTVKLPQPVNPTQEDRIAFAPYNFVPLPEKIITLSLNDLPDQDAYHPERLSGYLDCELETSSPLYVRAARTTQASQKDVSPEAFYYTHDPDHPVIPGSSLRGLLRSMVEVVSYSKLSAVTNQKQIYRAVGDITDHGKHYRDLIMRDDGEHNREKYYTPLVKGGYVVQKGHEWYIQPAQVIAGTTYAHMKIDEAFFKRLTRLPGTQNAYEVYIECGPYDYQPVRGGFLRIKFARVIRADAHPAPGLRKATLAISGWMASKRSEAVIFDRDPQAKLLHLKDELIDDYEAQISQEQKRLLGDKGVLRPGQPVFYIVENDQVVFFGHGRMLRMPYRQSPLDKIPPALRRAEDLDLAEALFGYIKNVPETGKARGYAGRVFVGDAGIAAGQKDLWLANPKTVTLKILGGPKPTTFQHYLVQRSPDKIKIGETRDGKPKYEIRLADYTSPETTLRGQKFYWHKGAVGEQEIGADMQKLKEEELRKNKPDTQHPRAQPLRAGVQFQFRVHFENLSSIELGALLWVLQIASQDPYRLKLGMGKPLGMGAVRISAKTYLIDRSARYQQVFLGSGWASGLQADPAPEARITAFEQFILHNLGQPAGKLEEVERIQALLTLLRWPGPNAEWTRYMEIEHADPTARQGKRNEYKERPVLPTPFGVWAKAGGKTPVHTAPAVVAEIPPGYERGTVKDFGLGASRSFGFITPASGGADIFVHQNALAPGVTTLERGQKVVFKRTQGMRGQQASDVRVVK